MTAHFREIEAAAMTALGYVEREALNHFGWKAIEYIGGRVADFLSNIVGAICGAILGDLLIAPLIDLQTKIKTAVVLGGIGLCVGGILLSLRSARPAIQ
jgi:hypothetical protein